MFWLFEDCVVGCFSLLCGFGWIYVRCFNSRLYVVAESLVYREDFSETDIDDCTSYHLFWHAWFLLT